MMKDLSTSESLKSYIHFLKYRSHCLRIDKYLMLILTEIEFAISYNCFVVNHNKEKTFKTDTDELMFKTENHAEHN